METLLTAATVPFLAGIVGVLAVGLGRGDTAAAVNALASLATALLPVGLSVALPYWPGWTVQIPPELTLWLAVAGLLHSIGMLGPYDTVWWWDHLTHLVSATLVAALLYAGLLVLARPPNGVAASGHLVAASTVLLSLFAGAFWELIELVARDVGERLDVEPMLVHYGWRDTTMDLAFDVLGAGVVVALDVRTFVALADESVRATRALVLASSGLFVLGSVAFLVIVGREHGQ